VARNLHPSAFIMKIDLSHPRSPEGTTTAKIVGAGITGMLSFVSAVFTTVVESGGVWQYLWLGACIFFFVCAASLVVLASIEGLRIDHTGLSFEPHDRSPVPDQKTRMGEDHRVV
jgi:hypothetical protein